MRRLNKNNNKRLTLRNVLLVVCSLLFIFVIAYGAYVYSLLNRMRYDPERDGQPDEATVEPTQPASSWTPMPSPEPTPTLDMTPKTNAEYGVINIMLFGVDNRYKNSYSGRSDVNVILTLDTVNKEIRMASILRDTLVYLPSQQDYNRLNSAIVYEEGPEGAVAVIENSFNIDIDHYMISSFRKVARIIETVGGIDVYITQDEMWCLNGNLQEMNLLYGYDRDKDMVYTAGNVHLNGMQAVAYARIREIDNDMERSDRQMKVLTSFKEKLANADMDTFNTLLEVITDNVKTDMSPTELLDVATTLYGLRGGNLKETRAPFEGYYEVTNYNEMSILKINEDKTKELLRGFVYYGVEPQ